MSLRMTMTCRLKIWIFVLVVGCLTEIPNAAVTQDMVPVVGFQPIQQRKHFSLDSSWTQVWGDGEFTEGPAVAENGSVFFSDIGNRMMKYDPKSKKTIVFRKPSHRSNGLFFRNDGALIACEGANVGGGRRITITKPSRDTQAIVNKNYKTLVDRFEGKRLNSPNDLFVTPNGNVFFTDPRYVGEEPVELDFQGVFRVAPNGSISVATKTLTRPNGILVNSKETLAFVAEHHPTGDKHLVRFDIDRKGKFSNKKILFDFGQARGIDGMCFGPDGNIYATAGDKLNSGIYVFSVDGKQLAFQATPGAPTNCTFGKGENSKRLYLTSALAIPKDENDSPKYGLLYLDLK